MILASPAEAAAVVFSVLGVPGGPAVAPGGRVHRPLGSPFVVVGAVGGFAIAASAAQREAVAKAKAEEIATVI